jgi:hypothetical protein
MSAAVDHQRRPVRARRSPVGSRSRQVVRQVQDVWFWNAR